MAHPEGASSPAPPLGADVVASLTEGAAVLAPMVRAGTLPLRLLALRHGAVSVWTEETVDHKLRLCERRENARLGTVDFVLPQGAGGGGGGKGGGGGGGGGSGVVLRVAPGEEGGRLVLQLGSGNDVRAQQAAEVAARDAAAIEINMGCPKRFSLQDSMGAALLSDAERAFRIISRLRASLPASVPVFGKIRVLPDDKDGRRTVEFARGLVHSGASLVTLHLRTPGHKETVPRLAEANFLTPVADALRAEQVPLMANGDIYSLAEADAMAACGACGVMLARPALHNVSVFRQHAWARRRRAALGGYQGRGWENWRSSDGSAPTVAAEGTQKAEEGAGFDEPMPKLVPLWDVCSEYLKIAYAFDNHVGNTKYTVMEMLTHRRHPKGRVKRGELACKGAVNPDKAGKYKLVDLQAASRLKGFPALLDAFGITEEAERYKGAVIHQGADGAGEEQRVSELPRRYEDSYFFRPEDEENGAEQCCTTGKKRPRDEEEQPAQAAPPKKESSA